MKIAGSFLWKVKVRDSDLSLWVTTDADSARAVLKKLPAALRRNDLDPRKHPVRTIEFHGTLDG